MANEPSKQRGTKKVRRTARRSSPAPRSPRAQSDAPGEPTGGEAAGGGRIDWSKRATLRVGAVVVVGIFVAALLWRAWGPPEPSVDAEAPHVQLVALLAAPPGAVLPDVAELMAQVVALRGRSERPLLREMLDDGPTRVRLNAVRLLALMKDRSIEAVVKDMTRDADELVRLVALDCAGRLGESPPLDEFERALASSRVDVRCYAIDALEHVGGVDAIGLLEELTRHVEGTTRTAALRAVLALDASALNLRPAGRSESISVELASRVEPPRTSDRTRPTRRSSGARTARASAARPPERPEAAAERRPASKVAPERDAEPEVVTGSRRRPASPPAATPAPEVAPPRVEANVATTATVKAKATPSPIELVRREAPQLLEQRMYTDVIQRVTNVMAEIDEEDAELYRFRGLAHLGEGAVDEAIADLHRGIDLAPDMNRAYFDLAVCYAEKRQVRNAYSALTMSLRFGFRDILAIRGESRLDRLKGTPAFRSLMEHYFHSPLAAEDDGEKRLRFSLKRIQSEFQRYRSDPFGRALAVLRFPEPGSLEATEYLFRLLKDREVIVRRTAAEVLSRTRDAESIAYLCERLEDSGTSAQQREAVMWALHHVDGEAVVDALLTGLADRDPAVQLAAARALGDRPDRRAVAPLIELLEDVEPLDGLAVAQSLGKITGRDLGLVAKDWRNWWDAHSERVEIGAVQNPCAGSATTGTVFIPPSFSRRYGKSKRRALAQFGGTRATEAAVERALAWLARHQSPDGRWDTDEWALTCDQRKAWERVTRVRRRSWDTQITGVALMAFLGAGYTHLSGTYHDTVRRGLEFLKKRQRADGYFTGDHHHWHRSHEIATIAVGEAYLMTRDCRLKDSVERAIGFILQRQHLNGGWGWHKQESYTSLTGWNLLAMVTASDAGVRVPASAIVSARHFLDKVTVVENGQERKAGFAFETLRPAAEVGESLSVEEHEEARGGGSALSTTVGLCCRMLLGQNASDARVSGALAQLRKAAPRRDAKGHVAVDERLFFGTQAALWHGGAVWKEWNRALQSALLGAVEADGCERGTWAPSNDYGRVYSTALGAVILESYYRFGIATRS